MIEAIKVYVVGDDWAYANWLLSTRVETMSQANLVMFTGGVDVHPRIYGKKNHPMTQPPNNMRDAREKELFELASAMNLPMVGICRGAQFLCAMAGGILVQHQQHPSFHDITTHDGKTIGVTSDHHQRMYPWVPGLNFKVLAWCNGLSDINEGESEQDDMTRPDGMEAEIVHFPDIKALGIQPHPEWMYPWKSRGEQDAILYMRSLVRQLIDKTL